MGQRPQAQPGGRSGARVWGCGVGSRSSLLSPGVKLGSGGAEDTGAGLTVGQVTQRQPPELQPVLHLPAEAGQAALFCMKSIRCGWAGCTGLLSSAAVGIQKILTGLGGDGEENLESGLIVRRLGDSARPRLIPRPRLRSGSRGLRKAILL